MSKRKKNKQNVVSPELEALIKVTEEDVQRALSKLKYKIIPPEESNVKKKKRGQLYCPYCGEYKLFKAKNNNGYITYKRCTGCGISVEDFYVKKYNRLFQNTGK